MQSLRLHRFVMHGLIAAGLALLLPAAGFAAPVRTIELNHGWEFRQATDLNHGIAHSQWLPAAVPGDIPLDLLRNKLISDSHFRVDGNNPKFIVDATWEYRTTFPADAALLNRNRVELVFDGIDTCAEVFLNGNLVLSPDNMFRTYRVNAKPGLKIGNNDLLVRINPPMQCAKRNQAKDKWSPEIKVAAKQYLRKAAVNWNQGGIWRPVRLEAWDDARIANLYIEQPDVSAQAAHLLARVEINSTAETAATIKASYSSGKKKSTVERTINLHPGINVADLPVNIKNPELWYPAGYGAQPLYDFQTSVSINGAVQDTAHARAGLRSVELRQAPDQWGRSFEFVVNGIPVFAKGADVAPLTKYFNDATPQRIRDILQSVKGANMNMIRIWGGGIYNPDYFYEVCDELGIMVWQDFMFYNPWQPGNYEFKQDVAAEITDQLKRLRNHPSLVLWCGNNEEENNYLMDSAVHNDAKSPVSPMGRLQMWTDYLTVFSGIIPTLVARYDAATPYWPSSPSGEYGETKGRNYWILEEGDDVGGNEEFGDTHDYTIGSSVDTGMPRLPFSVELDRHYR
ncbi:MAG: sugar-binding domain-containing protein, partial [Acidobacteriaceae bacterium]